ncbi:MAG TPA: hypothetical protein DCR93_30645 [Cytophagales bacterium]|nr:hypothetical protein [Cytophagales bacterium]
MIIETILKRWYVALLIVPILVKWLSKLVLESPVLSEPKDLALVFSAVVILILAIELSKRGESSLTDHDQKIATGLIRGIDLDSFQQEFFDHDAWYGFREEAILGSTLFVYDTEKFSYKPKNKVLKRRIESLKKALEYFHDYSKNNLYGPRNNGWLINIHRGAPYDDKEKGEKLYRESSEEMNRRKALVLKPFEAYLGFIHRYNLMPLYREVREQYLIEEDEVIEGL